MSEEEIMRIVVNESVNIHKKIGPGLLESVYKTCLAFRLQKHGLYVQVEKPVPVFFDDVKMECGYRVDIFVKNVVIEVKSIAAICDIDVAQMLTYLRFLNCRFGLILNFNTMLMKNGIKRVVNGY